MHGALDDGVLGKKVASTLGNYVAPIKALGLDNRQPASRTYNPS